MKKLLAVIFGPALLLATVVVGLWTIGAWIGRVVAILVEHC